VARSTYFPWLDISSSATKGLSGSYGALGIHGLPASPFKSMFGASVNLWWSLYDFGRTSAGVDSAVARAQAAQTRTSMAKWLIRYEVAMQFHECIRFEEVYSASSSLVRERETRRQRIQEMRDSGLRSEVDLALAQADLARAAGWEHQSRAQAEVCRVRLAAMLGRDTRSGDIPVGLKVPQFPAPVQGSLDTWIGEALDARRDRAALIHERGALEGRIAGASARNLPEVKMAASGGYARLREGIEDPEYYAVGVAVRVPVFEGFAVSAERDALMAELRAMDAHLAELDIVIAAEIRAAVAAMTAGRARVELAGKAVSAAEQALSLAQREYEAGLVDALRVSTAERSVWDARADAASARSELGRGLASFEHAMGRVD